MPVVLFLLFLVVPIVELAVILQVGDVIGLFPTILLLLGVSIVGAVLVRREGTRAWRRFREALAAARLPTREVVDGALVVLGGALMLTPGFVTDVAGLLLVIPLTRPLVRRLVMRRVRVVTIGDRVDPFGGVRGPLGGDDRPRGPRGFPGGARPRRGSGPGPDSGTGGAHRTRPRPPGPSRDRDDREVVDIEVVSIERNEPPQQRDDDEEQRER